MIIDYDVVCGHDIWVLKARVKEMLAEGWQPFNELQVSTPVVDGKVIPFYAQVVVQITD